MALFSVNLAELAKARDSSEAMRDIAVRRKARTSSLAQTGSREEPSVTCARAGFLHLGAVPAVRRFLSLRHLDVRYKLIGDKTLIYEPPVTARAGGTGSAGFWTGG